MKRKFIFLLFLMSFASISAFSQDPGFSQYFSNPLALNPAFAGSQGCSRVAIDYKNFPYQYGSAAYNSSASYDQFARPFSGGLGIQFISTSNFDGYFKSNIVNAMYAFNLRINENLHIRPAMNFGFGFNQMDWGKLFSNPSIDSTSTKNYLNLGAGLLVAYKNLNLGFSLDHLNKPNIAFSGDYKLPAKLAIHGSYQVDLNENAKLTPALIYFQQEDFKNMVYELMFKFYFIKAGAGFRQGFLNPDGAMFMLGYCSDKLSIAYNYDLTVSKLSNATGGTHEISAVFKFNCKNEKKKYGITPFAGY